MEALDDAALVQGLRALGDTRRFRMVRELALAGELSCGQLGGRFELSQATVSHHLKLLIEAGLVRARPHGQHHLVSVNRRRLTSLTSSVRSRLAGPAPRSARVAPAPRRARP